MKVNIIDFIVAIGNICKEHSSNQNSCCIKCPFCIEKDNFHGCIKDDMSNKEFAEIIKNETLKYMKK